MRATAVLVLLASLGACRSTSAQGDDPQEDLRERIEELTQELLRLRQDLVRARIELLDWKLREARKNPEEERRLLVREGLNSEFSELQQHAFKELVALPLERRRAVVPDVLERWRTSNERFRVFAVPFLSAAEDPRAEEALLAAALDSSPDVRRAVAGVLNASSNPRAFSRLLEMLEDPQRDVRAAAIDSIGGSRLEEAIRPLLEFLRTEKDPTLQERAIDALGKIGKPDAVETLLSLLQSEHENVRWSCISSLGIIGDPQAVGKLRPFLSPDHPLHIREITIVSLGKLKDSESLSTLEAILLEDSQPRLRQAAAEAIGRLGQSRALETALWPTYAIEKEEAVRKAIWKSILRICEKEIGLLEALTSWVVSHGYRTELEEVARRVYAWKGTNDSATIVAIVVRIADFTYREKSWLQALEHYKMLIGYAPEQWEGYRRMSRCYVELGDFESAATTLSGAAEKAIADRTAWWSLKEEALTVLLRINDPVRILEETYALLNTNPSAAPETLQKTLQAAYDSAAERIVEQLRSPEEAARKAAISQAKKLGKRLILPLAAAILSAPSPGVIEAGNAITGTALEPSVTDALRLRETAEAWKSWYEKNK